MVAGPYEIATEALAHRRHRPSSRRSACWGCPPDDAAAAAAGSVARCSGCSCSRSGTSTRRQPVRRAGARPARRAARDAAQRPQGRPAGAAPPGAGVRPRSGACARGAAAAGRPGGPRRPARSAAARRRRAPRRLRAAAAHRRPAPAGMGRRPAGVAGGRRLPRPRRRRPAHLVVPGSGFGQQRGAGPSTSRCRALAGRRGSTRSQVPLVPGPTIRYLDAIEERVADGQGSPGLADLWRGRASARSSSATTSTSSPAGTRPRAGRPRRLAKPWPGAGGSFGRTGFGEQPMIDLYRVDRAVSRVRRRRPRRRDHARRWA